MKPITFIKKMLPKETKLFPEQEKLLTTFYEGDYTELVGILGRRSGKDLIISLITAYECYRLLELDDPFKHYGLEKGNPIYILLLGPSQDQAKLLFTQVKILLSNSSYFRNKISKIETDRIYLNNSHGEPSFCVLSASVNSNDLLGRRYFCLMFNEIDYFKENISEYSKLCSRLTNFKQDGHIIMMSRPYSEEGILYDLVTTPSTRRLIWKKSTWEINPKITEEKLRAEFKFMSEQDFNNEFGANFRTSDNNTTVSIRLPSSQLETRVKAYENDTDISYEIQDY